MIGVDYELFWTLNPRTLKPFIKAFTLKQEYDNAIIWKQGDYIRRAIADAFSKSDIYPKKPDSMGKPKSDVMSDEEIKRRMMSRMGIINQRFRKEETPTEY